MRSLNYMLICLNLTSLLVFYFENMFITLQTGFIIEGMVFYVETSQKVCAYLEKYCYSEIMNIWKLFECFLTIFAVENNAWKMFRTHTNVDA